MIDVPQTEVGHLAELDAAVRVGQAERLRAAGAGIGAFFCPTGYGTELATGKETREINGRHYVLEYPIHGDVALIKAEKGDRWGNLTYRMSARNFGPVMATAANAPGTAAKYNAWRIPKTDTSTAASSGPATAPRLSPARSSP